MCQFCEELAKQAIAEFDEDKIVERSPKTPNEETIFDRLLTDNARRQKKGQIAKPLTYQELADESIAILNAGTEPTATMLTYATYFFLRFPEVQEAILAELDSVERDIHGRLPLQKIERLPYFVRTTR